MSETERAARICDLYADWCGNWGMDSNASAAQQGAAECAKMIRSFPQHIDLPADDDAAGEAIVHWLWRQPGGPWEAKPADQGTTP